MVMMVCSYSRYEYMARGELSEIQCFSLRDSSDKYIRTILMVLYVAIPIRFRMKQYLYTDYFDGFVCSNTR